MPRRIDIQAILADPMQREALLEAATDFIVAVRDSSPEPHTVVPYSPLPGCAYIVVCTDDGHYVLATRQTFDELAEAVAYANTVADSRKPLVIEGRWDQLRGPGAPRMPSPAEAAAYEDAEADDRDEGRWPAEGVCPVCRVASYLIDGLLPEHSVEANYTNERGERAMAVCSGSGRPYKKGS